MAVATATYPSSYQPRAGGTWLLSVYRQLRKNTEAPFVAAHDVHDHHVMPIGEICRSALLVKAARSKEGCQQLRCGGRRWRSCPTTDFQAPACFSCILHLPLAICARTYPLMTGVVDVLSYSATYSYPKYAF